MMDLMGAEPHRRAPPRRLALVPKARSRRRAARVAALVAFAASIALGDWLLVRGHDSSPAPATDVVTARVSLAGLQTLAGVVPNPIFWAGPEPGYTYELSKNDKDFVWIRYLPPGIDVGSNTLVLTVGTYPMQDAFAATSRLAETRRSVRIPIGGGGVAFYDRSAPTSVYVAYPGTDVQVEVYDPVAERARRIVEAGRVRPVTP